ncbi:MAG: DEAD/DEAH box helicase family protein, partial [Ignavibacteria bacterium]
IDLVAKTYDGDYWAIQCKCYQEGAVINKPEVDTFISISSRTFKNENVQTTGFAHRLWISTTNNWGPNAEETIRNQHIALSRISLYELEEAPVDWEKLEKGISGEESRAIKKKLFPHQIIAVNSANEYFKKSDRGKLIMACGTGKTFTSLKIAEKETNGKGLILFLVPSIALLGQTLREWAAEADEDINAICICSDPEVSKKKKQNEDSDGYSVVDLALPASTNVKDIVRQFNHLNRISEVFSGKTSEILSKKPGMIVVFSTYQSIDVISKAQAALIKQSPNKEKPFGIFDLIICDEAHRTTGVTLSDEEESSFVKVHDNKFLGAKKRIYMTATPRLYNEESKSKAAQAEAVLCSMDDVKLYGEEIYRIGFGEAVEKDLLSDYKVLILTINETDMPASVQKMVANPDNEINSDDASKLIGCINAFSKRILGDAGVLKSTDPEPMRRAVAFCQSIKVSKKISTAFVETKDIYFESLTSDAREKLVSVNADHVDGTMSAPVRDDKLSWLKSSTGDSNECRVLTNVRCLSEGVDVPSLDAVLFLSARNSQVDVVQSVGRVMRKAKNKKYGYIIIPIVVPADIEPDKALNDNERFKVVWTVLNALRAHDDRFNATINKIELNKKKPTQILVGTPDFNLDKNGKVGEPDKSSAYAAATSELGKQISMQFEQLQSIVFARMVQKVGDRRYWEQWAADVAKIAERHIARIRLLIHDEGKHQKTFEKFLKGLQKNINPSIDQEQAIEMLAQHIITKPVFEALFEGYSFVKNNPISVSMQTMLDLLEGKSLEKDTETLQRFYDSVKSRAGGIDNAEGKQKIIIELYDKFFKTAFPRMVEKLGIVYTPVEVVDFIIRSVEDVLQKEFGRSISDENIHVLDP